ncbi:MAG TPA: 2Fe-2S iron-sulfur cluster-binding protein [Spongiibacteraceae bacterium]|nr:2Fe-2S iron-sulfur cluster-binding protein [Spongiibacteraceae bacterium]
MSTRIYRELATVVSPVFRVSLPDGSHYEARDDENLLAAAQRSHWLVRYGCRNGNCDACGAQLLQGSVQHADGSIIAAPAKKILLCLCRPRSELHIALPSNPRPGSLDQSLRSYARLQRQTVAQHASILSFALPAGRKPALLADQIALIETDAGLLQGHIDFERSQGRELIITLAFASPLQEGAYYHIRYPLNAMPSRESHDD